jgi:hypothetical protein
MFVFFIRDFFHNLCKFILARAESDAKLAILEKELDVERTAKANLESKLKQQEGRETNGKEDADDNSNVTKERNDGTREEDGEQKMDERLQEALKVPTINHMLLVLFYSSPSNSWRKRSARRRWNSTGNKSKSSRNCLTSNRQTRRKCGLNTRRTSWLGTNSIRSTCSVLRCK